MKTLESRLLSQRTFAGPCVSPKMSRGKRDHPAFSGLSP
ncbi:coatomer protein complex, subunit zeta 2 (predicted), isoform CRA_b [Rattus norvegicus]|uniref:Coatomer protein complex, subunit zeta 2 (Predicted), isoform CRA_b n=1 Tax=Rattus norvegicus TaxID=10116 RepID=A6HIG9_RAT|nr:coatomer protein complex, subunit zeta 2 (predicted), isoform CRA_b [Rattus norvegicus]